MAEKFLDKVKYFIGFDVFENEEQEDEDATPDRDDMVSMYRNKKNRVVNIHTKSQMRVIIYKPTVYEEIPSIVDDLKSRRPVVINLLSTDKDLAKKFFDFLNGAIYALDGNIQKVSNGIFILAPNNIDIEGNIKEELKNKGIFPWQK
ncbi:MAG: cell division protein SepF [Alkaliphilus sp.]|nr:cell division protein SepF [bacterium AH-315-E09]PHS35478.1 MAG: cell division protein SepF [Alkaliphilus sp.]